MPQLQLVLERSLELRVVGDGAPEDYLVYGVGVGHRQDPTQLLVNGIVSEGHEASPCNIQTLHFCYIMLSSPTNCNADVTVKLDGPVPVDGHTPRVLQC